MLEPRVTVRGARAFTRTLPGGEPVVMVHGAVVSSDYFVPLAKALAPQFSPWLVDLPGYGRSAALEHPLHVDEAADWLAEWMGEVAVERAHLVGNSLGAQVAVAFAQRHPARTDRLVLIAPTVDPASRSRTSQLARLAADAFLEHPTLHLTWFRDFARCGPKYAWKTLEVALDDAIEARLPHIAAETLVLRGEHDPLVSRAWGEQVARLLPRGRYVEVPGAAHGAHHRRADEIGALVRGFLGEG